MAETSQSSVRKGIVLVAGSAIVWSIGGAISRFLTVQDSWNVVFWRSLFAALFLAIYMVMTSGPTATLKMFRDMGWAGFAVACCFAVASTCFVVALAYTTVANILLVQAGVPLIAALLAWILFGEAVSTPTKIAIAAVIAGVGIMVSESITGRVSPVGDGLAVLIAFMFAIATVLTRRHAEVLMLPAVCLATTMAGIFASFMMHHVAVSAADFGLLILFGAVNLGAGLAMFSSGARLVPAAMAALIGTIEPVLAPLWVWLIHNEVPSARTLGGGLVVFTALLVHLLLQARMAIQITEDKSNYAH